MKSQKCKTCDQIYVAIKACARPGQGSTDTKLSSSIVPSYIGEESLGSSKDQTKHSRKSCSSSKAFSSLQPMLHRAFEQKLYYLTFIFLYGWNKTFKILALVPNDLFKGKHICRAVIKVSPGHLSEPLGCKMDIFYLRSLEQKLGPAAECGSVCLHIWSIPGGQTNVTLKRNSHYFRLICKNWPLTLITASHCGGLGPGLFLSSTWCSRACSVWCG